MFNKEDFTAFVKRNLPQRVGLGLLSLIEARNRKNRAVARAQLGVRALEDLELASTKGADTVYILGSGDSINEINETRWSMIRSADSFAMNFWLAHEFIPTHYFYEASYPNFTAYLIQLILKKFESYRNVSKILIPNAGQAGSNELQFMELPEEWRATTYAAELIRVFARDRSELDWLITRLRKNGMFPVDQSRMGMVFKHMGSVTSLISVAANMGYKSIVLTGIDMNGNPYFYDNDEYPQMVAFREQVRKPFEKTAKKRLASEIGGDEVIYALNEMILKPANIGLYVENSSSKLHEKLPVFPHE